MNDELIELRAKVDEQAREIERLSAKLRTALLDSAELAALKAQPLGVVLPERKDSWVLHGDEYHHAEGFNEALDEVARLNQPASGGERNPVNHKYLMGAIEQLASIEKSQNARESRMAATPASGGDDAEEAFEEYARPLGFDLTVPKVGDYTSPDTLKVWHGFKAGAQWRAGSAISASGGDERAAFEAVYASVVDNGWTNVKHMAWQVWQQARAALPVREAVAGVDYKRKFECLVEHAKRQDRVIAEMRYDENIRRFYDDGAVWFWAGDETDNLETLACPVVINAGDLRALLAAAPSPSREGE